uniref:Sm protein B n=1 Tax=Lygus hesperus TaxID=30085 RepID=A0A0A9YDW8_LYGHE
MVKTNMLHHINKVLKIIMDDGREMNGKLLVYDQHMNVVLSDTTELRPQTKKMKTENIVPKRHLGLVLLRGEHVVSVTVTNSDQHGISGSSDDKSRYTNTGNASRLPLAGVKRVRMEDKDMET